MTTFRRGSVRTGGGVQLSSLSSPLPPALASLLPVAQRQAHAHTIACAIAAADERQRLEQEHAEALQGDHAARVAAIRAGTTEPRAREPKIAAQLRNAEQREAAAREAASDASDELLATALELVPQASAALAEQRSENLQRAREAIDEAERALLGVGAIEAQSQWLSLLASQAAAHPFTPQHSSLESDARGALAAMREAVDRQARRARPAGAFTTSVGGPVRAITSAY